ncbi:unnamed protein product [Sphagnum jensenii]
MGLLVVVTTFLIIIVHRLIVRRSILLPPGPWMWPLVGVIPFLGSLPHQALANLAQQYGPLMYVRFGSTPCIVVSSSMLAEKFLKTHDQVFQNRPKTLVGKVFNLDNAIALSSGPHWRHLRKICSTQLFTPTCIQSFEVVRKNEISLIMNEIYVEANASKVVNLKYHMSAIATNSLAQMIFSKRHQELQDFKDHFQNVMFWLGAFIIGDHIPSLKWLTKLQGVEAKMQKLDEKLTKSFQRLLDEHAKATPNTRDSKNDDLPKDFMDVLLKMPSEDGTGSLPLCTLKPLVMFDLLGAGTDTTSILLEWAMAELMQNPEIMKQAQTELDTVVGIDRVVQESDIQQLRLLQAIIKETFRLHPPTPLLLPHQTNEAWQSVEGYNLPPKTQLLVNVWAIGRDPNNWERPLEFDPTRFMKDPKIDMTCQDFRLLPFGSGRRACPGRVLGILLLHIILARLLQSFDWYIPDKQGPNGLDMSEKSNGINNIKSQVLLARAHPRLPSHLYE